MPTSDYILNLRKKVGHDMLWLPGALALVLNDKDELLLSRRPDDNSWGLIGGFVELDEQPVDAAIREVLSESGLEVEPQRVASVTAYERTYRNGDQCRYLDTAFICRVVGGALTVANDESLGFEWFALDKLPKMGDHDRLVVDNAFSTSAEAWYAPPKGRPSTSNHNA